MHLQFRQLQVFEAIARHKSLTKAADELNVTQPAISIQLQKLEAEVGLSLVERSGRQIALTEAGEELLKHAERMSRDMTDMEESLEQFRGLNSGRLRLAVVSTANYFLATEIAEFRERYPGIEITLQVANRDDVQRALEANEADLAITGRPPEDSDVVARPFMDNPLIVIAAPDHPLAGRKNIAMAELAEYQLVAREEGSGTRAAREKAFADRGLECKVSCVLSSNEAVKQAVQAGLGVATISAQTSQLEIETGRLVSLDIDAFPIMRQWYVVYRSYKRLPPAALAFRNQLLE